MALIIKADMPKGCCWYDEEGHCIRCFHLLDCEQGTPYDAVRPSGCTILGEIPDNHGKLKDYDKIKEVLTKNFDVHADSLVYYILGLIDETDTVLEAST